MPVAVKLICADPKLENAAAGFDSAGRSPRKRRRRYEAIAGTTHFLQIERPAECIQAMEEFLARKRLSSPDCAINQ